MTPARLHPDDLAELARQVAEYLHDQQPPPATDYLAVDGYCARFGVSRSTVYARADELGAVRIGGALRLPSTPPRREPAPARSTTPRTSVTPAGTSRHSTGPATVPLLPIGSEKAAA